MNRTAAEHAKQMRRRYHASISVDVVQLIEQTSIQLRSWPLRLPAFYGTEQGLAYIAIADTIEVDSRQWRCLVAHELGHWCFDHTYDVVAMCSGYWDNLIASKCERQANVFVYELLMPAQECRRMWRRYVYLDEMADYFGVTMQFAQGRMSHLLTHGF